MKTRALRLHLAAHEDGMWTVAVIEDVYERGQLRSSDLVRCEHTALAEVRTLADYHIDRVIEQELGRLAMAG